MSQQELVATLVAALEGLGIEYMFTGSLVSSLQGEPRSSHDIDVVVALREDDIPRLRRAFPASNYYLSESAASEALRSEGMFNVVKPDTGDTIDFWVLKSDAYSRSYFERRERVPFESYTAFVSRSEDTILCKLLWTRACGGSEKHLHDALRVYEVQYELLDLEYIEHWTRELGLDDLWRQLTEKARPV